MKRLFVGALCAVATTAMSATPASAAPPVKAKAPLSVLDKLYDDYVEEYWIWAFNQPSEVNPLLGGEPSCTDSSSGRTVYLSGTFLDGPQERSCDVDRGQWLYLSILSSIYIAFESDPPETKTYQAMLDFAQCSDATASVTVDGHTFNATKSYTKTGKFDFPVEEGGLLEEMLEGEGADGAVVAGIHVLLPPLPRGKHTIRWTAESEMCGLVKDLTYTIKVH